MIVAGVPDMSSRDPRGSAKFPATSAAVQMGTGLRRHIAFVSLSRH